VVEGVHVVPGRELIQRWEDCGGVAIGCLLTVTDEKTHKKLLRRRGFITGVVDAEEKKMKSMERVRIIQEEMIRLSNESGWIQIEQKLEPDPLEIVASKLWSIATDEEDFFNDDDDKDINEDKDCSIPPSFNNTRLADHVNESSEVEL
jgi:2-phosphoglycerate kinase